MTLTNDPNDVVLGQSLDTSAPVLIPGMVRRRGTYIVGRTGSGKSSLIKDLALQDIANGNGVGVLDPNGDLVDDLLSRIPRRRLQDVVLLNPANTELPFGLNPFWCNDFDDLAERGRRANQFVELFDRLWGLEGMMGSSWGPRIPMMLRAAAYAFIASRRYTLVEIRRLLTDKSFLEHVLHDVDDEYYQEFWKDFRAWSNNDRRNITDSTLNKLDEFLSQPLIRHLFGQSIPTFNLRELTDTGKIILIPLYSGRLTDRVADLFGLIFTLEFYNAASSRIDTSNRKQFNLFVDEYARFSTPSFSRLLTEGRKYAFAVTFAHQTRAQLDDLNRAASVNAGCIVIMQVSGADAVELSREADKTPPEELKYEDVKSASANSVEHILHAGHPSLSVTYTVNRFLRRLVEEEPPIPTSNDPRPQDAPNYIWRANKRRNGLRLINDYLRRASDGNVAHGSKAEVRALTEILWTLQNYFGIWSYLALGLEADKVALEEFVETYIHYSKLPPPDDEEAELTRYIGRKKAKETLAKTWLMCDPENAGLHTQLLLILANELRKQPILVASATRVVKVAQSTFADSQAAIANALLTQPSFQGLCRIDTGSGAPSQQFIKTAAFQLLDEVHKERARTDMVRQMLQAGYVRSVDDVRREIEERGRWDDSDDQGTSRVVPL